MALNQCPFEDLGIGLLDSDYAVVSGPDVAALVGKDGLHVIVTPTLQITVRTFTDLK